MKWYFQCSGELIDYSILSKSITKVSESTIAGQTASMSWQISNRGISRGCIMANGEALGNKMRRVIDVGATLVLKRRVKGSLELPQIEPAKPQRDSSWQTTQVGWSIQIKGPPGQNSLPFINVHSFGTSNQYCLLDILISGTYQYIGGTNLILMKMKL